MRKLNVLFIFLAIPLLCSCASSNATQNSATYQKISVEKAHKMMSETKDYILLDVRTLAEYNEKHIKGAFLIPVDLIRSQADKDLPDKNQPIFVYCRTGVRAASASQELANMGYTKVYNIGGIVEWPYGTVSK